MTVLIRMFEKTLKALGHFFWGMFLPVSYIKNFTDKPHALGAAGTLVGGIFCLPFIIAGFDFHPIFFIQPVICICSLIISGLIYFYEITKKEIHDSLD